MSAWYLLSALGFYQVDPAGGDWAIGSPAVRSARIDLGSGRALQIRAIGNSPSNIYVQSATFNGIAFDSDRMFLSWDELRQGGELILQMGPQPILSEVE